MMKETFKEYMIKQKKSTQDLAMQIGIIVIGVILAYLGMVFGKGFGPLIVTVIVCGVFYLMSYFSKEYEYILTNNELDIDVIYSASRRKRVLTVDMKKIDIMAPCDDKVHSQELQKSKKVINASDNDATHTTYAIMSNQREGDLKILITPSEDFLDELYRQAPSKIIKKN